MPRLTAVPFLLAVLAAACADGAASTTAPGAPNADAQKAGRAYAHAPGTYVLESIGPLTGDPIVYMEERCPWGRQATALRETVTLRPDGSARVTLQATEFVGEAPPRERLYVKDGTWAPFLLPDRQPVQHHSGFASVQVTIPPLPPNTSTAIYTFRLDSANVVRRFLSVSRGTICEKVTPDLVDPAWTYRRVAE